MSTLRQIQLVKWALSQGRMSTYDAATGNQSDEHSFALDLYIWNAKVSGAFLPPLHICEVVLRNAVAEAIAAKYGDNWPWSTAFEQSLPNALSGYSTRHDLLNARHKFQAGQTGKVIPELKFVFWQRMFTGRHDVRIWDVHLLNVLPGLDHSKAVAALRKSLFDDLETVRRLRNRIAHHEPIFNRNLSDDFDLIIKITTYRSREAADWVLGHQKVQALLESKPWPGSLAPA